MNHIKRLQLDKDCLEMERRAMLNGILELRVYLSGSKFHTDTTVQVADVMHRLFEIVSQSDNEANDYRNAAIVRDREEQAMYDARPKQSCEVSGCGYFGKDWVDGDLGGYSMRLCRKHFEAKLASHEILGEVAL